MNKKLIHIQEQEINYCQILDQEKLGQKTAMACSTMPLVFLLTILSKEDQIDIKNFQNRIASKELYQEVLQSPSEKKLNSLEKSKGL